MASTRPFIGRAAELAALDDALSAVERGLPAAVEVVGLASRVRR